jgi:ABC-type multidrug transport system ATPase subunit
MQVNQNQPANNSSRETIQGIIQKEVFRPFEFSMKPIPKIEMQFRDVNIWAQTKEGKLCAKKLVNKRILNNLSGCFRAGTATAIIGSSGSGKTSLLNYLSARMNDSALQVNGQVYINGVSVPSIQKVKHLVAYVQQQDVVFADLTPYEHFYYTAKLSGLANPEERAEEIIASLGLKGCRDTQIGDDLKRGISGGERKRTSVGIELITDPSLLFLDEPTTGLDSKSALDVAILLRMLADNGRTIIATLHCPSSEILKNFDQIICLCKGEIVYDGPPTQIIDHFGSLGHPVPPLTNPADHLMTIIHPDDIRIEHLKTSSAPLDDEQVSAEFKKRLQKFVSSYRSKAKVTKITTEGHEPYDSLVSRKKTVSTCGNLVTLYKRTSLIYFRNPNSFKVKFLQTIVFGLLMILMYNDVIDHKLNTAQALIDKGGVAFSSVSTMAFAGVFSNIYVFLPSLGTYRREQSNKLYGPLSYYCIGAFFELPWLAVFVVIYQVIFYWVVNFKRESGMDFLYVFITYFTA